MSDYRLRTEVNRVIQEANISQPKSCVCSIIRIMKMRHKQVEMDRIIKITKEVVA
ncbi:hypothetical protein [Halarcobacter ebronensis]|uniref:hypothetical protein n=1 Tax=Halarcobacter ebronensis TaxID=1462615 RepID=UPI0013E98B93|nr:hypothetical protein [Halarcobacter ebronensis]QKF81286.1 hypothetical protein AEBR_0786 [Halarcobacter ebronensis]